MSRDIISAFENVRVLVIGDVLVDKFVYGHVSRRSSDGVPILTTDKSEIALGGASNVAKSIVSLGAQVSLIGVVGDDAAGISLQRLLRAETRIEASIVVLPGRRTSHKTRFLAADHHLLRVDDEDTMQIELEILKSAIDSRILSADIVVLSDYSKGVLPGRTVRYVISRARIAGKKVVADLKSARVDCYDGASVLTPSYDDMRGGLRQRLGDDPPANMIADAVLRDAPNVGALLLTRGPDGMTLYVRGCAERHYETAARTVRSCVGAGDVVTATLAVALAAGADLPSGVEVANVVAGLAVGKPALEAVSFDDLVAALGCRASCASQEKVMQLSGLALNVAAWRATGARIGFTNGCFDLLHPGHVSLLFQARSVCDRLVVGLNSDASIRRLKGNGRPIQPQAQRASVLASLAQVDAVVTFDEDTPIGLIHAVQPDILIKGADYSLTDVVGAEFVRSYGGHVLLANLLPGWSTTDTISRCVTR